MSFENLGLNEAILLALKSEGYTTPTPIQSRAIPILLTGKDLLGCAQTGTGKTAAFALPIIHHLKQAEHRGPRVIRALIVTPTRELAIQIDESFAAYGRFSGLKHTVIFGGVGQGSQVQALKSGVDILVATPGRLLDLHEQGYIHLNHLTHFVLDEADRMLDMGFIHDVKKLIRIIPARRQSLFFSATMPDAIKTLAASILTHPEYVEVTPVSSTAETIQQEIFFVDQANKYELLLHVLQDKSIASALVFTRTKHGADKVVKFLVKNHVKAEAIHGNKSQNHRQRALNNFKDRSTRVLVATDIAARGIDIDELAFVINFEVPNISETYVHRIGRTGRAGASGKAISFCDVAERPYLRDIQKLIKMEIPVHVAHPFQATKLPEEVKTLAPKVAPQLRRPSTSHSKPLHQARTDQERQSGPSEQSAKSNRRKRWFKKKKKETPNHIQ